MQRANTESPSILIIGTGFGGLGMAIQLKKAGYHNITLLEKASQASSNTITPTMPVVASVANRRPSEMRQQWRSLRGLRVQLLKMATAKKLIGRKSQPISTGMDKKLKLSFMLNSLHRVGILCRECSIDKNGL